MSHPKRHGNRTFHLIRSNPDYQARNPLFRDPGTPETFMRDYHRILMNNFQKIRIESGMEYWTCGQKHDPRNWDWKQWYHLDRLCRKRGL